jgi:hypothetical protein
MPDGTAPVAITTQGDCKAGVQGRYKVLPAPIQAKTKEECAKEVEKLRWLGTIEETDYLFMFTLKDQNNAAPSCKVC